MIVNAYKHVCKLNCCVYLFLRLYVLYITLNDCVCIDASCIYCQNFRLARLFTCMGFLSLWSVYVLRVYIWGVYALHVYTFYVANPTNVFISRVLYLHRLSMTVLVSMPRVYTAKTLD